VFEAAGNAACLITDDWPGIPTFFAPGREILVARTADDIVHYLRTVTPADARAIGQAAHARVLRDHTYALRAREVDELLRGLEVGDWGLVETEMSASSASEPSASGSPSPIPHPPPSNPQPP
jgi:hypothetical protein